MNLAETARTVPCSWQAIGYIGLQEARREGSVHLRPALHGTFACRSSSVTVFCASGGVHAANRLVLECRRYLDRWLRLRVRLVDDPAPRPVGLPAGHFDGRTPVG